jgi:hypothetical protein
MEFQRSRGYADTSVVAETSPTLQDFAVAISLTGFVVMPLLSLLHELGHALVALRVAPGLVQVHVGRPPGLRVESRRLRIGFNIFPANGVSFVGLCIRERVSSDPRKELLVVLAGPVMTLLAAIALAVLALGSIDGEQHWLTLTFAFGALSALLSFLKNVYPRSTSLRHNKRQQFVRDGPKALAYYRLWRAGQQAHTPTAARVAQHDVPATERRQSVPPPGYE